MSSSDPITLGRLSRLHLLPADFDPLITELLDAIINRRSTTQKAARTALNDRLAVHGISPISNGSWSRFVLGQVSAGIEPRFRLPDTAATVAVPVERYASVGRVSTVHRLPAVLDEFVAGLLHAILLARSITQTEARDTLNKRLMSDGISAISNGSWNRFVIRQHRGGIEPRYQLAGMAGGVTISLPRYTELLEIESAHRRLKDL
jgi:hypothetical protein